MSPAAKLSLLEAIYLALEVVEAHAGDDFHGQIVVNFSGGRHRAGSVSVVMRDPDGHKIKTTVELVAGRGLDRPLAPTGLDVLDCRRSRRMSGERR
jgi:hypothetical protein